jgi:hypothetical protein
MNKMIKLSERVRYQLDWYGECRTCKFWDCDRGNLTQSPCMNQKSDLYQKVTTSGGDCKHWVNFDEEASEIAFNWDGRGDSPDILLAEQETEGGNE